MITIEKIYNLAKELGYNLDHITLSDSVRLKNEICKTLEKFETIKN